MLRLLKGLLGRSSERTQGAERRSHLYMDELPDTLYAIGDIHGCIDQLVRLEDMIKRDADREPGSKVMIRLGDYVDRGPDSAAVLDRLTQPTRSDLRAINLAGNHEAVMLDFLRNPRPDHEWLNFGGIQTLHSYGIYKIPQRSRDLANVIAAHVPEEHFTLLETLPSLASFPGYTFVHAGAEPGLALQDHGDDILLWKRPSTKPETYPYVLVHGHTPVERVEVINGRINVDTGAYATGNLSAVKIRKSGEISVISCN